MIDESENRRVAITGLGILCSLGKGVARCWEKVLSGESGVVSTEEVFGLDFPVKVYAPIQEEGEYPTYGINRALAFIDDVINQAVQQAGLSNSKVQNSQLILAICPFDQTWAARSQQLRNLDDPWDAFDRIDRECSDIINSTAIMKLMTDVMTRLQLKRTPIMLHTACSSGNSAIQYGLEAIEDGEVDTVIVVGCEISTTAEALIRFNLLGTLASQTDKPEDAARPFSKDRSGFVLGEGAAALVLERADQPRSHHLAYILGVGDSVDTFHRTRSDPDAKAAIKAVEMALDNSEILPTEIDSINAHGTGTLENDKTEAICINLVFGENGKNIPITSNKSIVGHTLSAAGVIEAVFCVKSLESSLIPPTLNHRLPDPDIDLNVVSAALPVADMKTILSNSFGFGGQNVCVVFSKF